MMIHNNSTSSIGLFSAEMANYYKILHAESPALNLKMDSTLLVGELFVPADCLSVQNFVDNRAVSRYSLEINNNVSFRTRNLRSAIQKLVQEVTDAYILANETYPELEQSQLLAAYIEAVHLAGSGLFHDEIIPQVGVDSCGEFIFWHRTGISYVDIGVCGESVLSYHVRNYANPNQTAFDDHEWSDFDIPKRLIDALDALRKIL